jgi:hypothetical protein
MWVLSAVIARYPAPLPGRIRHFLPRSHDINTPIRSSTAGGGWLLVAHQTHHIPAQLLH